ncbi:AfsR/SARP family transcriptional regulator [Catenulispora rubra]|uniref:AfsR/SARP family transcriptional regulator n=1 Tax=Catenulispora rubra TaxID=280293 RepID=UPI00189258DC|nr:BTAD domain-containing putative transcriptional regulator [Catenulispora rubra]
MSSTVWFGLLGPVDIRLDGVPSPLPSARTRALLAALLCQANRVVSVDGLVDAVWGADPPDGAVTTLRSHVMRLRRCLGSEAGRLETAAPGYRILLDPGTELDTRIFVARYQAGQAAAAAGDWHTAARFAAEALALWRGEPLADVPSELLHLEEAAAWAELRVEAIELRARADIALGRAADAVAPLRRLAADHPHREPAYALLMSALAAADRRAEALQVYRLLRAVLVRDLGMEPSPELRALHQGILAMDAGKKAAVADGVGDGAAETAIAEPEGTDDELNASFVAWPTPRTLPWDTADFTGREDELRRIVEAVTRSLESRAAFAVVIDGMAGVGKSALATHAAHLLTDRFPDGQLYADLLGSSPSPADPHDVLTSFLRLLGIAPADLPTSGLERGALYRSLLAERRVLVLLDDVHDGKQLAPLIPSAPGSVLLATTRDRHVGIAGALRVSLSPLTPPESHTLLVRMAGAERTTAEPEATAEILAACAGLPLALRAAGGRIAARPTWQIADLASRLARPNGADGARFFDELRYGDHDVRATFETAFAALAATGSGTTLATSLCLLGLWNGTELGLPVAASLLDRPPADAEQILERLVDLNLLQSPRHGRYLLHDLIREFAAVKADSLLTDDQRRQAADLWRLPHARSADSAALRDDGLSQPS